MIEISRKIHLFIIKKKIFIRNSAAGAASFTLHSKIMEGLKGITLYIGYGLVLIVDI